MEEAGYQVKIKDPVGQEGFVGVHIGAGQHSEVRDEC